MLKKGLNMSLAFAHNVIQAMLLLHNWIIDNTITDLPQEKYTEEEAYIAWAHWSEIIEETRDDMRGLTGDTWMTSTAKRDNMVGLLRDARVVRPDPRVEANRHLNRNAFIIEEENFDVDVETDDGLGDGDVDVEMRVPDDDLQT